MKTATYVGGPLAGQTVTKPGPGGWATYRGDDGLPIPTHRGDREFCSFAGRHLRRYYVHEVTAQGAVYVHATVVKERDAA